MHTPQPEPDSPTGDENDRDPDIQQPPVPPDRAPDVIPQRDPPPPGRREPPPMIA